MSNNFICLLWDEVSSGSKRVLWSDIKLTETFRESHAQWLMEGAAVLQVGVNPIHHFLKNFMNIQENLVLKNGDARRPLPLPPLPESATANGRGAKSTFSNISINHVELKEI